MTPESTPRPTLREAALKAKETWDERDFFGVGPGLVKIDRWLGRMYDDMKTIEAALSAVEEEKPKVEVERTYLGRASWRGIIWHNHEATCSCPRIPNTGDAEVYAERPRPVPSKREELADRCEEAVRTGLGDRNDLLLQAAAELRKKEGGT